VTCRRLFETEPADDPWGGAQPKLDSIARVGKRRYVLRGRHAFTGHPVEVPIAGGVRFEMRLPKRLDGR
jgi:hypothetical protein